MNEKQMKNDREIAVLFDVFFRRAGGWIKHQFDRQVEKYKYNLTSAQYKILTLISRMQPCRMSDLSEAALVSTSSLTIMLNRLVEEGLVERLSSAEDRRVIKVQLTEEGKVLLKKTHDGYLDVLEEIITGLGEEQKDTLVRLLEEVNVIMETIGRSKKEQE